MSKNIKEVAGEFARMLKHKEIERNGEDKKTIVVFKDNATQELKDAVYQAHGERLPDDWIFEKFSDILNAVGDYDVETLDDLQENRPEIVDGLVDVYTSNLTGWLHSSPHNVYYITEAQQEYGAQEDGFKILQMAQYKAIDEIFGEVMSLLEKNIDEDEQEADDQN